ncbi:MAG: serine/threonine-protein kinase [Anaerolineales bacterium]
MATLKPGDTLKDRYRIRRFISRGGMGSIYLADDLRLDGRLCAIKEVLLDSSLPGDTKRQTREQFQREAIVLARQICNALIFLHSQDPPILHRDIKPSNLKLTPNDVVKLVDFGLVKILSTDDATITIVQGRGTALYTPLEQYGGDTGHTDARSDIYALGATLYHLLTNTPPAEARERFLHPERSVQMREINPDISPRTERAIDWALSLHPDHRPESMVMFREALLGNWNPGPRQKGALPPPSVSDVISSAVERSLIWVSAGLVIISLIATLSH